MAKPLMILGTSSGAGKSTLAAGLCRIFSQDGWPTAPFKAQNMSNNAYVLPDGRQMAKSQAIAAAACGLVPDPDMNPILLKYSHGSLEVIRRGHPAGPMDISQYQADHLKAWPVILEAYANIARDRSVMVLEGAGSPVEMNLKAQDVVNLSLALRVGAPALLVADIDRGGAFASVVGTLQLLDEEERRHVKGIILNRLHGNKAQFETLADTMTALTGLPVVGLVPYLDLKLEDEDGLVDPATGHKGPQTGPQLLRELDQLAAQLRLSLDLERIYTILLKGV